MIKQYKGKKDTIEIDEKNMVIKTPGFFTSTKKVIPLRDITKVALGTSFFPEDTVEIYYQNNIARIRFAGPCGAKEAVDGIAEVIARGKNPAAFGEFTASMFEIGASIASILKTDSENQKKRKIAKAEAEYQKALEEVLHSGKLTLTTYINGREFKRPTSKNDIKTLFLAEYAKSPLTTEQPWAQMWTEQYGIRDVPAYLQAVIEEGYLEEAVLGKALSTLTVEELKAILAELSMKTSGVKGALIQRLVEAADEETVRRLLPYPVYALTEKGIARLRANQLMLADMWIDCEKAIKRGQNIAPEFSETEPKKAKKKRAPQKPLTDAEKLREYKKSLRILYEALKGPEIREQISVIKSCRPTRRELEQELREICANACYSPVPYTETLGNICRYRDFYSEEIIDQIYKGQTRYMLFDRTEFSDLVQKIAGEGPFDFLRCIDEKWDLFVTVYMRNH